MRDLALFAHIILGLALIVLPLLIIPELRNKKSKTLRPYSILTAITGWVMLLPAGNLYTVYYPATKTLIKAGSQPWAHSIIMETKEHWGILLPVFATVAAGLVIAGRAKESKKWWQLVMILSILIALMGRVIVMGAGA
ncbi:MAG: hypothetical protein GOV15_00775 [Candidatus Diapherotrites archaeon]|nr:hypothetical protein [Candidatus Diapherotrites archaeon]